MAVADPVLAGSGRRLALARDRVSGLGGLERAALAALLLVTVIALVAPLLAPHDPAEQVADPFLGPGEGGLLGTDDNGRDVLSRTLLGMRASWLSALAVVAFGVAVGGLVGLVAALAGGVVDSVLMRLTDAALALPGPVLAIAVVVALGPSLEHTLLGVAAVWWPWYARIVRSEARALLVRPHVDAARVGGAGHAAVGLRHVLPGVLPPVVVAASLDVGVLVLTLAGLSFIGLGAPPPAAELGAMTAQGLESLFSYPWIPLVPAVAVFVLSFAANLAGDGLRDLLEDV